jgi:hypothetical protein
MNATTLDNPQWKRFKGWHIIVSLLLGLIMRITAVTILHQLRLP